MRIDWSKSNAYFLRNSLSLRKVLMAIVLILSPACFSPSSFAQRESTVEIAGHFGGYLATVAVPENGSTVYVGEGSGFIALDISNPSRIRHAASLPFPDGGDVNGIALVGSVAYLANGTGLQIVDISDGLHPVPLGSYKTPGTANAVQIVETTAYIADGWDGGLQIIDVSDPANPVRLGSYDTPKNALGVAVADRVAYIADAAGGLQVIDVTNPRKPALLKAYTPPAAATLAISVAARKAYLACGTTGIVVLDVTDPRKPAQLTIYDTPGSVSDVKVIGETAYVADGSTGLLVLNVSNPRDITPIYTAAGAWSAEEVAMQGNTVYVLGNNELRILDASDLTSPGTLGTFAVPAYITDMRVSADGRFGYLAGDGFWVVDLLDPLLPFPLGKCPLPYADGVRLFPNGYSVYAATGGAGLKIIDVRDPANPAVSAEYLLRAPVRDVFAVGDHAYVLADRLRILDVSNPAAPFEVGMFTTPGDSRRLVILDSLAYVAAGTAGVRVIDVTDPAHPLALAPIASPPGFAAHAVSAATIRQRTPRLCLASVRDTDSWLQCFDLTNPQSPLLLAREYLKGSYLKDIQLAAEYLYAAGSLYVFDASDLEQALKQIAAIYGVAVENLEVYPSQTQPNTWIIFVTLSSYGSQIYQQTTQPAELARIEVTPGEANLKVGEQQQFTARGFDANNNEVPIEPIWSATGGTITSRGMVRAAAATMGTQVIYTAGNLPGHYRLTAAVGEVAGHAWATILGLAPPDLAPRSNLGAHLFHGGRLSLLRRLHAAPAGDGGSQSHGGYAAHAERNIRHFCFYHRHRL